MKQEKHRKTLTEPVTPADKEIFLVAHEVSEELTVSFTAPKVSQLHFLFLFRSYIKMC
jgi:hypothetical protein